MKKKLVHYVTLSVALISLMSIQMTMATDTEHKAATIQKQLEESLESDVIVLSREQAMKIMHVLECVVETYQKDGSLDLPGQGARAALSCCAQLDEVVQCLLLIKSSLATIQVIDTSILGTVESCCSVIEGQIATNQSTLVSLLQTIISCTCT